MPEMQDLWAITWRSPLSVKAATSLCNLLAAASLYLERQVAQNHRPLYPKVAHKGAKVAHNYRLRAFQVAIHIYVYIHIYIYIYIYMPLKEPFKGNRSTIAQAPLMSVQARTPRYPRKPYSGGCQNYGPFLGAHIKGDIYYICSKLWSLFGEPMLKIDMDVDIDTDS